MGGGKNQRLQLMGTAATRYKLVRSKIRLERRRQIGAAAHEALAAALPYLLGLGAVRARLRAETPWLGQAGAGMCSQRGNAAGQQDSPLEGPLGLRAPSFSTSF